MVLDHVGEHLGFGWSDAGGSLHPMNPARRGRSLCPLPPCPLLFAPYRGGSGRSNSNSIGSVLLVHLRIRASVTFTVPGFGRSAATEDPSRSTPGPSPRPAVV